MQDHRIVEVTSFLNWNQRMLSPIGMWPKDNDRNLRFALSFVYISIHVTMEWAEFVQHVGNLGKIIENLSESVTYTMLLVKMAVFYKNRTLCQMIDAMNEDGANHKHASLNQQKLYATYNARTKIFCQIILILVSTTALLYYVKPLAGYLFASIDNTMVTLILPYRTPFSFERTDVYKYSLAYVYESITLPIVTLGFIGTDGLLITLTMHVCGQLSILAKNIANLKKDEQNGYCIALGDIVRQHLRLIWMAKRIDAAFTTILMGQLLGNTLLICLNGVHVIMNSERTRSASLLTFAVFEATMLTFLYSYCFIGECLVRESKRVFDAFYLSTWYDMSPSQSKNLIICMIRSQRPLYLTAGRFYVFSLENFTQVRLNSYSMYNPATAIWLEDILSFVDSAYLFVYSLVMLH